MDELAIGFSLGLVRPSLALAAQAFIVSQLGLALGAKISATLRGRAEQIAAIALIVLGAFLVVERLIS